MSSRPIDFSAFYGIWFGENLPDQAAIRGDEFIYTTPYASIASATFLKPAMLAPST